MDVLHAFTQNLLSPPILFFALGLLAGVIKSDLDVPETISRYFSLYLMMSIGFKGGVAIANTPVFTAEVWWTIAAGLAFGALQPFLGYVLLKRTARLDSATAAAVAAHYGSISMVTFVTATTFLKANDISYAGYIVAVVALMEAPAIMSGLFIAHRADPRTRGHDSETRQMMTHDIFTNGAILLLTGAFVVGMLTGQKGLDQVAGFLVAPFYGILCLFLLDMGLRVAREGRNLRHFSWPLVAFAVYMPLLSAGVGLGLARLIGLDVGTGLLFVVLCASASYIAVPAAMRLALPEAKASVYVPMSLALTFPFNVTIGVPLYYALAQWGLG